ncbi:MAG: toll/interleukin-1 receptor domain-containing protein [Gammaproteobacteria bacterium]|nr:toll/interleukin-1 receptor domain-containing protein [Gammaproteobacteria bacterium]
MGNVFVCYRRGDAPRRLPRLLTDLQLAFGPLAIVNAGAQALGLATPESLHDRIAASDVFVLITGPRWLAAAGDDGTRRIDDPHDSVRREIETAQDLGKPIVVAQIGDAAPLRLADLPAALHGLATIQPVALDDAHWQASFERLRERIAALFPGAAAAPVDDPYVRLAALRAPLSVAPDSAAASAAGRVFISHASDDESFAGDIAAAIEGRGYRCWIAPRDIPPGTASWAGAIADGVTGSRLLLVLLTGRAMASRQVLREIALADQHGLALLAVRADAEALSKEMRYYFTAAQRLEVAAVARPDALRAVADAVALQLGPSAGSPRG